MSRVGKKPVVIPQGVTVEYKENIVFVSGKNGKLDQKINGAIDIEVKDNIVTVYPKAEDKKTRALHGLYRALINNMVIGVANKHEKVLEIHGVGYKIEKLGNYVVLSLGYSHPIYFEVPDGITFDIVNPNSTVSKPAEFKISGINKQLVGEISAKIRSYRKPEPYKGKGVRYKDEYIKILPGKAGKK